MKVLVLSCKTGGGHNACAKYIKEEFNQNKIKCDVKDYLEITVKKTSEIAEKIYLGTTKGKGDVFKAIYHLGEMYNSTKLPSPVYGLNKLIKNKLKKYIEESKYDVVICTHLFPSMALTDLKKEGFGVKFVNVATDYECIPFWNETNPDLFVIPSVLLKNSFISKGIKEEIIMTSGIPVSSKFQNIKNKINLKSDKDIVMIASGSMGFGNILELVKSILNSISDIYVLVICGNNLKLQKELKLIKNDRLIIKGFVNNINEYMAKSTIIVTKPGGLTTTEVAVLRKPLIHMMPIPGVENYNALFFAENKMSLKASNIEEVVLKISELLKDKKLQKELVSNQDKIINKNSAKDLIEYILRNWQ